MQDCTEGIISMSAHVLFFLRTKNSTLEKAGILPMNRTWLKQAVKKCVPGGYHRWCTVGS